MNTRSNETRNNMARIALATALVIALSGMVGAWSAPPDGGSDRMARKMNVLEKIFDEVLRESSNVSVSGGATRGLLLDGYGALFLFDGSLTGGGLGYIAFGDYNRALGSYFRSDYPTPATAPRVSSGDDVEILVPGSVEEMAESWEVRREESRKESKERLAGLKVELTETLLDYGATLGELSDDNWVVVAAFLGGFSFDGAGPEQLVLKVKMRDLRQYSAGQLSLDQAKNRVSIEEQ